MAKEENSAETKSGLLASDYPLSAYSAYCQADLCLVH